MTLGIVFLVFGGCGPPDRGNVRLQVEQPFPEKLSEWQLFVGGLAELHPNKGVVPYDLTTPLFKDYASKHRFVWMPPGTSAVYSDADVFQFPLGTIFSKTFSYPNEGSGGRSGRERLIETRLLIHTKAGWVGLPYVWNQAQTEARLEVAPDPVTVHWAHPSGKRVTIEYVIPNTNQCKECHENSKVMSPLGPKARNLNRDYDYAEGRANQLVYLTRIGYLKGAPAPDRLPRAPVWEDPATGTLEQRARAYLDVQCANCHNARGPANSSGLYLGVNITEPLRLGVCKVPVSAGQGSGDLRFDIVPGHPEASILVRRMDSITPKVMMPEVGRSVVDREGVELIREWVASLRGDCEHPVSETRPRQVVRAHSRSVSPAAF